MLLDELERERWKRLEAQVRVKQLMREHLELKRERLASGISGTSNPLERDLQKLQQALKAPKKGLWIDLLRSNNHQAPSGDRSESQEPPLGCGGRTAHLRATPRTA